MAKQLVIDLDKLDSEDLEVIEDNLLGFHIDYDVIEVEQDKLNKMQECIDKANAFFNDVMPQIGKLCIQDYQNLNELGVALSQLKSD